MEVINMKHYLCIALKKKKLRDEFPKIKLDYGEVEMSYMVVTNSLVSTTGRIKLDVDVKE